MGSRPLKYFSAWISSKTVFGLLFFAVNDSVEESTENGFNQHQFRAHPPSRSCRETVVMLRSDERDGLRNQTSVPTSPTGIVGEGNTLLNLVQLSDSHCRGANGLKNGYYFRKQSFRSQQVLTICAFS